MESLILDIKGFSKVSTFNAAWTLLLTSHTGKGELQDKAAKSQTPRSNTHSLIHKDMDVK